MDTLYRQTKWLRFLIVEEKPKTIVLNVVNTSHQFLGDIRWYGPWRQYTYTPEENTTFNHQCLKDIASVLDTLNAAHKKQNNNGTPKM